MLLFINEIFSIGWKDVIDIILVAYLIFAFYNLIRGTAALRIFLGILAVYLIWKLVEAIGLNMLTEILGQFIGVGVIALIIVFQQEIRRFLLMLGSQRIIDNRHSRFLFWKILKEEKEMEYENVVNACAEMSKTKTGALIVITSDKNELLDIQNTGLKMDAFISKDLLMNIFYKNAPMHDGAVLIHRNKITAAKCILPVSRRENLPADMGMRHRAAMGISENSDALSIIVSEQTGKISITKNGEITRGITTEQLSNTISEFLN
ncbi:MAG: TIGR00159 family protein [Marinilabiliales bacterium]|nr:MAG: TIGR00159 family protein [Marinilabiliales bacterium]